MELNEVRSFQEIDYDYFLSQQARRWEPAGIRGLFPLEEIPGMISFLAGKPNPTTFPFSSLSVSLKGSAPDAEPTKLTISGEDLDEALQYGPTAGSPRLLAWMIELQKECHKRGDPGTEGWKCSMGSGSQDLLVKGVAAICDPGEAILVETPAYAGTLGFLRPMQLNLIEVESDSGGMREDALERILESWHTDPKTSKLAFPKCLYTVPTGSNPAGSSASLDRKKSILALARKHNLLVLEDDVYFHLHFDKPHRAASYFELEKSHPAKNGECSGRVLRFDSFSKVLSSGIRLGLVSGPAAIVKIIDLHTANTNLQVPSTTQAMALALFSHWGIDGFLAHTDSVASFYLSQRNMACAAADKHLKGLAEWDPPIAGMFLWLKLLIAPEGEQGDSSALISTKAVAKGVLAVPGFSFMPGRGKSTYVRTSYSLLTAEQADEGFRRLADVVREHRQEIGLQ